MRIPDANVLIYAVNDDSADHRVSKSWLDAALSGAAPVGFAWLALVAFLRIGTRPGLLASPLSTGDALDIVDGWLGAPTATVLHPGPRHAGLMRDLLESAGAAGNLADDAHLAALAIEHKATIVTFDSDFGRFEGVRWAEPR